MYTTVVNEEYHFDLKDGAALSVLSDNEQGKIVAFGDEHYRTAVLGQDFENKLFKIKVDGNIYEVKIENEADRLVKKLGLKGGAAHKLNELKAPMPGLVLKIPVQVGESAAKGAIVIILEAMKMENALKVPADVVVKSILVKEGTAVEKNQVLMTFE